MQWHCTVSCIVIFHSNQFICLFDSLRPINNVSAKQTGLPGLNQYQSSWKSRITRIGKHVFSLGRMIFTRPEFRVRMFFSRHTLQIQ